MKKFVAVALAMILAFSFTACEKKNVDVTKEDVTLKLGLPSGGDLTPLSIVDSFKEKYPNITLEIDETPGAQFTQKLNMQIAAGNAPTVFFTDSGRIATLGAMGALIDLKDRVDSEIDTEEYSSGLFAGDDGNGHLWGVPHGLNIVGVYYNKKLFDEAGLPYPSEDWTFQDMFDTAEKLTKKDANGETVQYGLINGTFITDGWLPYILATGGAPLDETRTKSNFDDEKTIEGFRKMLEPVEKGISPSREWILSRGTPAAAFYGGNVGIYMALSSQVKNIKNNAPADFEYDVQMMPIGWDGERHCVYVPNLWGIYSRAPKAEQEAAWLWIKHFISEESQDAIAEWPFGAGFPVRNSSLDKVDEMIDTPANVKVFYEGIDKHGVTLFENATFTAWRPEVDEVSGNIINGVVDLEEGVKDIHKRVTTALEE